MPSSAIQVSVVIPVFNEELNLPALFARLYPVLDALGRPGPYGNPALAEQMRRALGIGS